MTENGDRLLTPEETLARMPTAEEFAAVLRGYTDYYARTEHGYD